MRTPQELEAALKAQDGGPTFFNNDQFPWTRVVESEWAQIRAEADRVLAALDLVPGIEELQVEQLGLTTDKRWKVFPFYAYGHWAQGNVRRCPATARAIQAIPTLQAAMYSVFEPKKSLPVHRGVYGGMLRYHMGIRVPKPETQCGIQVGGDTRHWREGEGMVFDDSHPHKAWNDSSEPRVILLADFTRPVIPALRALNDRVIVELQSSDYVLSAVRRWNEWEAVHGKRFDEALNEAGTRLRATPDA
jgi:beta-hydroxylase